MPARVAPAGAVGSLAILRARGLAEADFEGIIGSSEAVVGL